MTTTTERFMSRFHSNRLGVKSLVDITYPNRQVDKAISKKGLIKWSFGCFALALFVFYFGL